MRLLITALAFFLSFSVFGQSNVTDTITIKLNNYTVVYSQKYLQPLEVWYKVKCPYNVKKSDDCRGYFTNAISDSLGVNTSKDKHYEGNSWNKGHMASKETFDCSCDDLEETLTYLNCAIQDSSLNQDIWYKLEIWERSLAEKQEVFVHIKVAFNDTLTIDGATIPSGFFKTLIVDGNSESYYFPNTIPEKGKELEEYKIIDIN